jgi:transcriptional regulator with XRE-family HTH domain
MSKTVGHEFGRYIRAERVAADISLRKAAKALNVSAVYLGEVERGVRPPLKEDHWDALIRAIPTIDRDTLLERLTVKSRPVQLDLRDAPPQYQDLGLALARRIDKKNISTDELEKLIRILGNQNE